MAATNAERQKTFRERLKKRLAGVQTPQLPVKPKISVPATKRWDAMLTRAIAILTTRRDEMQEYHDDRTTQWQESERGEAFQERITELENIISDLEINY